MSIDPKEQAEAIRAKAREWGFDLVGFAAATPSAFAEYWRRWLAEGQAGDMYYLAERIEERLDPGKYLAGARTAICLAINYHVPLEPHVRGPGEGRVARYALPEDYHEWIKKRMHKVADWMRATWPGTHTKCGVDTAPIAERELAHRAGLGWIGKNTCLIHPRVGSWVFLSTILTNMELPLGKKEDDHCGTCTRCLDACPTEALSPDRPYEMKATECISYLTIEHRGEIPARLAGKMGEWMYGCDICQDVCPFNSPARIPSATEVKLQPRIPTGYIDAAAVAGWGEDEWFTFSRKSAIRRLGLPLFQRNARVVVQNAGGTNGEAGVRGDTGETPVTRADGGGPS